jgi:cellulose synthase/poly-beta-1,6-N-acetylglucosamine synthase-like glycosyltransferase
MLVVFGLHQFVLANVLRGRRRTVADPAAPDLWPKVTVQIPLYNEPDVAARVIDACAKLDYPPDRLEIQILDDSTDETPSIVARRVAHWRDRGLNLTHVRRDTRVGFKAGALQHGLTAAGGELVAIFDADFAPPPGFLRDMVPSLVAAPEVGAVQARWTHFNERENTLTRLSAYTLDIHFRMEQPARAAAGCFGGFNGTAGIWRRACIEDAGGWSGDTLTEDLDLSYRAQMRGWRIVYREDITVPGELPSTFSALRSQQFRWAKGTVQTACKLVPGLIAARLPVRVKAEGLAHLLAHTGFPALLTILVLHLPLNVLGVQPVPPGFALAAFVLGFGGCLAAHWLVLGARIRSFPGFLCLMVALSLINTRGVIEGAAGFRSPFVRTPKHGGSRAAGWSRPSLVEIFITVYALFGLMALLTLGIWHALPLQVLFAAGMLIPLGDGKMPRYSVLFWRRRLAEGGTP